ncbi:MAG: PqqD family protein [Rhodospirillales bacterium]|jgi:hypothetical protein|nr:PqqD family protein [Rhodospirillales bacterium]
MRNDRLHRKEGVFVKHLNNQAFLAHPETNAIFNLNELGCAIWHVLETPIYTEEIADLLYIAFPDIPEENIHSDLMSLILQLEQNGLISLSPT